MIVTLQQTTLKFPQILARAASGRLQRKCACGNHTPMGEECSECAKKKRSLQRKLAIGASNDPLENEADRIADQVMAMQMSFSRVTDAFLSIPIQRNTMQSSGMMNIASDSVDQALSSSGRPLEPALRQDMEQRFGYDFSQVQVHSDVAASQSAREVNAKAYTVGHDIVFGAGQFSPGTQEGRRLLAHELTHVVQQSVNYPSTLRRQSDDKKKEPASEVAKALKKNSLFKKLPEFAQEKILDEIDNAPETITQAVLDRIIDLAPIDEQYKGGLKKAGEAIIKTLTDRKAPSTSKCDIPGYHEGKSSLYRGMCCSSTIESESSCCPKDKFAPNNSPVCCGQDEYVTAGFKCKKIVPVDLSNICMPPGQKDSLGKCCMPPDEVVNGLCVSLPKQEPKPEPSSRPFNLKFTIGVIDDFDIDRSIINSRQQPHFDQVKDQILQFIEVCPASIITITGFADKPGTEEHNLELGQRRADHVKLLLQLDLMKIVSGGISPLILARSEGENNPVDPAAGEKFSAKNRRVEIEFQSICPPLGAPSLSKPPINTPLRMEFPQKFSF
ncbi:Outer membrane protein OmpA [Nitrosomonas nitrosa]|uniref:Outer membrane protein OmpA n=1 Tax=Nitrosomonas nitrosa TaxID=52442 RepID=A0A1I4M1H0_9PROT|nr:DUF4157 domain-containing protein [Nitrosomonas nitrosa]SFL96896.1 Outer membrane protein OmpA [Nitrosomonas nitrosa]